MFEGWYVGVHGAGSGGFTTWGKLENPGSKVSRISDVSLLALVGLPELQILLRTCRCEGGAGEPRDEEGQYGRVEAAQRNVKPTIGFCRI